MEPKIERKRSTLIGAEESQHIVSVHDIDDETAVIHAIPTISRQEEKLGVDPYQKLKRFRYTPAHLEEW